MANLVATPGCINFISYVLLLDRCLFVGVLAVTEEVFLHLKHLLVPNFQVGSGCFIKSLEKRKKAAVRNMVR